MGPVEISLLWLFSIAALYTDIRYRRVPNRLVLAALLAGGVVAAYGGPTALWRGFTGLALGLMLLFLPFTLGMVGGGDVKSLAVLGLLTGPSLLWVSFLRGAVAAGMAAAVFMLVRHRRHKSAGAAVTPSSWTLPYAGILSLATAISALFA